MIIPAENHLFFVQIVGKSFKIIANAEDNYEYQNKRNLFKNLQILICIIERGKFEVNLNYFLPL